MRRILPILLMLLLPLAAAQDPVSTVTVTATDSSVTASVDQTVEVDVTVAFDSQNPMDDQDPRDIRVTVDGVQDGWSVQVTPTVLELTSGQSGTVTLRIGVSADAEAAELDLSVTASLVPRGADPVPVLGETFDPAAEDSASITVTRDDSATRAVLETLGPWVWAILIGVLILAGLATKLALDARRIFVALHIDLSEVTVPAGGTVAVPVRVENLGKYEDTVVFHVASVEPGWSATLPVPELDLDGGATEELQLIVAAPKDAGPGSRHAIGISAHSAQAPRRIAEAIITAQVE